MPLDAKPVHGTDTAARFHTIVESARVNGIDGHAYLRYAAATVCRGEEPLLPHEWSQDS